MSTTATLHLTRNSALTALTAFAAIAAAVGPSSCAFFTLAAPCNDSSDCPFSRVCSSNVCVPAGAAQGEGEGEGSAGEGEGASAGEGEGVAGGEGEGEGAPPCSGDVVDVTADVILPGDEDTLAPDGDGCVHLHGGVQVGAGVTSLASFARLQTIDNDLEVRGTGLVNFLGADNLTSIGGQMIVRDNASLTSFDGLASLTSVGGGFDIRDNASLPPADVTAFENRF